MAGWDAGAAGIDPERVAELLVDLGGSGPGRRGSGYRVSASAVLTAAHVVRGAARVRVRFNADRPNEWLTEGSVAWLDPTVDAAVVTITPRPQDEGRVASVGFGQVAERDAVLACSAMGFPRFKLRDDPAQSLDDGSPSQYRDSHHAVGTIAVLSNRREGTLEVTVGPPERDPDPERSPWQGLSGAAVWSGGRIIGLIAEHYRADGLGRLAAVRVDRWYERLAAEQLDQLRTLLPMLPSKASGLLDVVPPTPSELLAAGYTAQVRDIAPEQLVGREQELAELIQFCAEKERYKWWQAEPWAGKSALAAWFVLHPPAGVTIVSFFVTRRLAGQADSDAFTEAMIEQLAAVAGEPIAGTATLAGRDRERRRLLDQAAARLAERQGRLLLVIDGLDEDESARLGGNKPSIASLLPKRPPDNAQVLVLSRPHPGVPGDVPGDHPLRHLTPRPLPSWSNAQDVRLQARQELLEQLHGDQLQVDVIGFITAAGGGLTLRELAELTRKPRYLLDGKLGSAFGRSLKTRLPSGTSPDDGASRVFLFAHETLRTTAEQELSDDLGPYREGIHAWADTYRAQGWPQGTPRYLLRPYGRLLATSRDLHRLVASVTDAGRHDRMFAYSQGDAAALAEITTAQEMLLAERVPDLVALGRLAVHRDRLANRNRAIPMELPAVWACLGQRQRAEALARSITRPEFQAWALARVAKALAEAGQWGGAEQIARSIPDPYAHAEALAAVADAWIEIDRARAVALATEAEKIARSIPKPDTQARTLQTLVRVLAKAGEWDYAQRTAHSITNTDVQAEALGTLAKILADAGRRDTADQIARGISNHPFGRAWALVTIAADQESVASLVTEAKRMARTHSDPDTLPKIHRAIMALVGAGHWDHAEQIAHSITNPSARTQAFMTVAGALAEVDRERAIALAADSMQTARSISEPNTQLEALRAVVQVLAKVGQWDHAEHTAHSMNTYSIIHHEAQAGAFHALIQALANTGRWDHAERIARGINNPHIQVMALVALAQALVRVDRERAAAVATQAEQVARNITDPHGRSRALLALAEALAEVDRERAVAVAAQAEQVARDISDPNTWTTTMQTLAEVLTEAGQWDHAEQAARNITDPDTQAETMAALLKAMIEGGQWDRATQAARNISHPITRSVFLAQLADLLAEFDREQAIVLATEAEQAARDITEPDVQAETLAVLADLLAAVDREQAIALAAEAEQAARDITDSDTQAATLAAVACSLAEVHRERAIALATEAEQAARDITGQEVQVRILHIVAKALAAAGEWDHAKQIAHSITEPGSQARSLDMLTQALLDAHEWDRAEETGCSLSNPYMRSTILTLVEALANAKRWDRAEQIARSIPEPGGQAVTLCRLTTILAEAGQWNRAEQTAHSISTDPYCQVIAFSAVAFFMAKVDRERAIALAAHAKRASQSITDSSSSSSSSSYAELRALIELAEALAAAGEWDAAEQAARRIPDSVWFGQAARAEALAAVVEALAEAGQWDRAKHIARSITDASRQASAYAAIAANLADASSLDPVEGGASLYERACRLLAEVLVGEHWREAIRVLGKLAPRTVVAINETLQALNVRARSVDG